jgi:hypothetical protein
VFTSSSEPGVYQIVDVGTQPRSVDCRQASFATALMTSSPGDGRPTGHANADQSVGQRRLAERVAPAQPGETGIVPVGGLPFAARFDCQGRMVRIGDEIALCVALLAQPAKNLPVPRPRLKEHRVGRAAEHVAEFEGDGQRCRLQEDTGVCDK